MSILDNPPHVVTINRPGYERDQDDVSNTTTFTAVATAQPAWVQNASTAEIIEYQRRDQKISDRVSFFGGKPDVQVGDTLVVTSAQSHAGVATRVGDTFTVIAMVERTAGYGLAWTAYCQIERPE